MVAVEHLDAVGPGVLDQGRAVEYGLHLYRPDRYAYETTLVDR